MPVFVCDHFGNCWVLRFTRVRLNRGTLGHSLCFAALRVRANGAVDVSTPTQRTQTNRPLPTQGYRSIGIRDTVVANGAMSPSNLNPISPNVYWLSPDDRTDRPILGAIAGEYRTLIVDAGNSPAHANLFLSELATLDLVPPAFLALTHWHWDHVFGTSAINLPTFAHTETKRIVAEMSRLDWSDEALDRRVEEGVEIEFCRDMIKAELPDRTRLRIKPPDIAFTTRIELDLGGVTCHIVHVGGDHTADSSISMCKRTRSCSWAIVWALISTAVRQAIQPRISFH